MKKLKDVKKSKKQNKMKKLRQLKKLKKLKDVKLSFRWLKSAGQGVQLGQEVENIIILDMCAYWPCLYDGWSVELFFQMT